MDNEIKSLQDKGVHHKAPVSAKEPGFVSSLFMVPKKGGGQRPVINLKALNNFVEYSHFKMEGIHMLRDPLRWLKTVSSTFQDLDFDVSL